MISTPDNQGRVAILVPIYKRQLEPLEQFSVDFSLSVASKRDCFFVAPEGLVLDYYASRYPTAKFQTFPSDYFRSIDDYSRLLLAPAFYERFTGYEFILILQPDAILFRDELDDWIGRSYDYIGAPWPDGLELTVWRDRFGGEYCRRVKASVGNGGLSLRRVNACLRLIHEFPETHAAFLGATANEDSFFSIMGLVSMDFSIPNEIVASRFAMELRPEFYLTVNGGHYPMGAHAWWIVQPHFWAPCLPPLAMALGEG